MTRRPAAPGDDRGAAAVEFALILPLLVLLVFGIIQFSRAYNAQAMIAGAARVAARDVALGNSTRAQQDVNTYLASLSKSGLKPISIPTSCPSGSSVSVTIRYDVPMMGRIIGALHLSGTGVMPCGG